ncbi:MAG: hypothetical protein Q9175_002583 [Cornicularia normoerica]
MAAAPTSINVYTIPTNGKEEPKLERFQTVETPISKLTYPHRLKPENQARLNRLKDAAADIHLFYDLPEGVQNDIHEGIYGGRYQPSIRFLPDTRKRWNKGEWKGWEKRAVIEIEEYHLFYVRGRGGPLKLNDHADRQVSGEMFLLRVSDEDEDGRRCYVDINPNEKKLEDLEDLDDIINSLSYPQYYGTQHEQIEILAYLLPQDGSPPRTQNIPVNFAPLNSILPLTRPAGLMPSQQTGWDKMKAAQTAFYVVHCRDERASQSTIERRSLPDIQPRRPKQWDDEAWQRHVAIGDAKYHMFCTLATGGRLRPNMNTSNGFLLWGDVFILKVSDDVDRNGRLFYEDIDADPEQLWAQMQIFIKQIANILEDVARIES